MNTAPIRIFLVDDHTLFREGLTAALNTQRDFQVVGHNGSAAEAGVLLPKAAPDILLVELGLPKQGGLELVRELATLSPRSKAIATGETEVEQDIVEAVRLGARGFLLKQTPSDLFLKCIRKVHSGEVWLNTRLTEAVFRTFGKQQPASATAAKGELSRRELEVIQLVVQGYKNRDIAQKLFISEKTVKNHLSAIFHKLGVNDRLEMTLYIFEKGIFSPNTL